MGDILIGEIKNTPKREHRIFLSNTLWLSPSPYKHKEITNRLVAEMLSLSCSF